MINYIEAFAKESRFADLVESVQFCSLCPRLCGRTKVLSSLNGNFNSKVLFIAEAPGRLGADRTGIPLYGDRSGDNFEKLLGNIGWKREQIFITNAVLCNPREKDGNNATPNSEEIVNCSAYLEMVIILVKPEIVISLGVTALKALNLISPHGINLQDGIARLVPWFGFKLFPLYHPGPRATVHRSLAKQRTDFMSLAKLVHPEKGLREAVRSRYKSTHLFAKEATSLQNVALAILEICGRMTYFKLTKLLYLVDLLSLQRLGSTVGSEVYLRQVDGPWPPKLDKALQTMNGYEVRRYFARQIPMVDAGPSPRLEVQLNDDIIEIVVEISEKYGRMSNSAIKSAVYCTEPMRFILREENKGKDMRNKAILYKDKTVADLMKNKKDYQ